MLSSACTVLIEHGFESFTFDEVARIVDIPIGTLYQLFANKHVVICELGCQDTAAIIEGVSRFGERAPTLKWPEFLSEFIDRLAKPWHEDVSGRAVQLAV